MQALERQLSLEGLNRKVSDASLSDECEVTNTKSISSLATTGCGSDAEASVRSRISSADSYASDEHCSWIQESDCFGVSANMPCLSYFNAPLPRRMMAIIPISTQLLSLLTSRRGHQRLRALRRKSSARIGLDVQSHVVYVCGSAQEAWNVRDELQALEGTAMSVSEALWKKLMQFRTVTDSIYSLASIQEKCNCRLHVDRLKMEVRVFGFEEDLPRAQMVLHEMEELVANTDKMEEQVEHVDVEVPECSSENVTATEVDGISCMEELHRSIQDFNLQPKYLEPKQTLKPTVGSEPCKVDLLVSPPPGLETSSGAAQKAKTSAPGSGPVQKMKMLKLVRDEVTGELETMLV
eukprot:TRINITY_DN10245_c0_g1_i5.p1 TRINITY_DN10245_c0_g1~~TRINITY_DN10245_c0_g1_i5.p1  ORF type:complete len:378 (+),score=79.11 TRINITY_DN10245_c0_g1_i5:84-1136(+)